MSRDETPDTTGLREAMRAAIDDLCDCGSISGCHDTKTRQALIELLAAHPTPDVSPDPAVEADRADAATALDAMREKAKAEERERIEAAALEFVREWTAMDGRGDAALMLHGRELSDFRDQLADVISGRAS